jgi:hypothetical protein
MALKDQILLLDRKLRQAPARDPEDADKQIFKDIDQPRLRAFGRYMADKVVHRFWGDRFPATIRGVAFCLGNHDTPLSTVAEAVMATDWFEQTIGEDVTGVALFGWLYSERLRFPAWLLELATYEYLLSCALPRMIQSQQRCAELEEKLLANLILIAPAEGDLAAEHVVLNKELAFICFDYPVTELQEVLSCGGCIESEVLPEPQAVLLALDDNGLLELDATYPAADLLQICCTPQNRQQLATIFPEQDIPLLLEQFIDLGLLRQ